LQVKVLPLPLLMLMLLLLAERLLGITRTYPLGVKERMGMIRCGCYSSPCTGVCRRYNNSNNSSSSSWWGCSRSLLLLRI
jgi:hypothetical protein